MKKILTILFFLFVVNAVNAHGADIIVDGDNACPGAGSSGDPYCTIQRAFDVVNAGDVVKIRNVTAGGGCYDENAILTRAGTVNSRITIQPDSGHNPCIRETGTSLTTGAIDIRANYVTVQNLTFNGAGISPVRFGLVVSALTADITGVIFTGNTVLNWGDAVDRRFVSIGAQTDSSSVFWVRQLQITNNTITDGRSRGISVGHTDAAVIEGNIITGLKCGFQSTNNSGAQGIKIGDDGINNIARNNFVSDHSLSCTGISTGTGTPLFVGIYCDTGPTGTLIEGNTVHDMVAGGSGSQDGVGIFNESRCHDSIIRNNIVYNIGRYGLRNGSPSTGDPNDSHWLHNTVYNVAGTAMWLRRGFRAEIKNNILHITSGGTVAIEVHSTAVTEGGHSINGNLYWDSGSGTKIGRWGDFTTDPFSTWKSDCGCDASSPTPFNPPVVSSSNLSLTSITNMNGVTLSPALPFNGSAPIIGAYDPPRLNAGACTTPDSTHLQLVFSNNKYPNLVASNFATGWTVTLGNTVSSGSAVGQTVTFTLGSAYGGSDDIEATYNSATGNITDNAPFTNKQKLLSITSFQCTNTIGGGSSPVLTQSNFQFYGLRTEGGLLVKRPHSGSPVNTNVKAVPRARFIVVLQIDGSVADSTAATYGPYISYKGGAYAAASDSFVDKIRYLGLADSSSDIPTQGGNPLTSCLAGPNTPITGSIQRTSSQIPTVVVTNGGCFTTGFIFELQDTVDATDYWEIRLRKGSTVLDTYTVTPRVTGIGIVAGF